MKFKCHEACTASVHMSTDEEEDKPFVLRTTRQVCTCRVRSASVQESAALSLQTVNKPTTPPDSRGSALSSPLLSSHLEQPLESLPDQRPAHGPFGQRQLAPSIARQAPAEAPQLPRQRQQQQQRQQRRERGGQRRQQPQHRSSQLRGPLAGIHRLRARRASEVRAHTQLLPGK